MIINSEFPTVADAKFDLHPHNEQPMTQNTVGQLQFRDLLTHLTQREECQGRFENIV